LKYIILSNPNGGLQNLLLLNIIVENIKKLITIEDEISLILWGTKPEENIYFKKENFKSLINIKGIKNHYRVIKKINKDDSKKIIIDLSETFLGRFYNFLIRKNKFFFHVINNKTNIGGDKKIIDLFKNLSKKLDLKITPILTPTEYLNIKELKKSTDYLNWTFKSSGLENINKIRFVYVLIKSENPEIFLEELNFLFKCLNEKINLKVILTFQNFENNSDQFIDQFGEKIKDKIIGRDFWSCDKNFIVNLILNSRFVFTDDEVYKFYSAKRDKYSILLEKVENNSKTNENDILRNRINSLIKNC
jgi:hypothetical protein